MKKVMMTAFAVVLAAGMASAANLSWNVAINACNTLPNGIAWDSSNQTTPVYYALILAGDVTTAVTTITTEGFVVNTSGGGESGIFLDWANSTGNRGASASTGDPNIATSTRILTTAQDYIAVAFVQVGGGDWYYWVSGLAEDKIGYTTDPSTGTAATFTSTLFNQNLDGWVLIPEPVSAALLALGLAAVGLRRRFRK
ncbi:MAG: PEP-CTERM sorting domain-containing protein [Kiritimatiellaeota bacterium]|nr:PEP-CTERM sorting domain-containing protein [Kiritimatiellota bacterium]